MSECVFCEIVAGRSPATMVDLPSGHPDVIAFVPLNPYVPGHVLVVPVEHLKDAAESPLGSGVVMAAASAYAKSLGQDANILTSIGPHATQTVEHLHLHVIPRGEDDLIGPRWPWLKYRSRRRWAIRYGDGEVDLSGATPGEAISVRESLRRKIDEKDYDPEDYEPMEIVTRIETQFESERNIWREAQ